jgi:hypothetical protein
MHNSPYYRNRFRTPLDFKERKDARLVCSFDAALALDGGAPHPVRIFNFSRAGFMLACTMSINSGARVSISLQGYGEARARILWYQGERAGGVFDDALDVDALVRHLEGLGAIARV